jgi:hypothetical protein
MLANRTGATLTGGTWDLSNGASVTFEGLASLATIAADVSLGGTSALLGASSQSVLAAHDVTVDGGTLLLVDDKVLPLTGHGVSVVGGGTVGGNGTITGSLVVTDGSVRPGATLDGDAVGTLHVTGATTLGADAELHVQVDGPDAADVDVLAVGGALTLLDGWTVADDWTGHPAPAYGFAQPFLTAGSVAATAAPAVWSALAAPRTAVVTGAATARVLEVTETGDPAAPTGATTTPAGGVPSNAGAVTFVPTGAADGPGESGVDHLVYVLDHAPVTALGAASGTATTGVPASFDVAIPAEGSDWYLHVAVVDAEGNVSSTVHRGPFVIDRTAAGAPAVSGAPTGSTSATSATLTLAGEAGASFLCSVDQRVLAPCGSPFGLDGLALGAHAVAVRQVDAAGNVSPATTVSWTVVAPPPTNPGPPTDPRPPSDPTADPTPPVAPKPAKVVFVGRQPAFAALGKGSFKAKLPVAEAGVKVKLELVLAAAQAKALGLKPRKGQRTVVVGTGIATARKAGSVTVTVRLTTAARNAFKAKSGKASRLASLKATIRATLSKGALAAKPVSKPVTLRR